MLFSNSLLTMKRIYLLFFVLVAFLSRSSLVFSAERPKQNPREQFCIFWGYPDNYLDHQSQEAFAKIDEVLKANKPSLKPNTSRDIALIALDMLLHDTRNDNTPVFRQFINMRLSDMLVELAKPVKKGVCVYKAYNDGFIIKSKTATIAIDLVPGGPQVQPFVSDSVIYGIASLCDAMFISHAHGDHANLRIAKAFAAAGKTVIVPKGLWTDVDPNIKQLLVADSAVTVPFPDLGMSLRILPGHQDDMYNNIYVMTFKGGITVAHTGDQYNEEDLAWLDNVHKDCKIDILLLNCWINDLERTVKGFAPKIIITGHENEMEHSIDHREAYWMTMHKYRNLGIPNVLMTWGESFAY